MKAGIITFHFPYNCGAVLQCLALQTSLEKLGAETCVVNYRPWYHQNRYVPFKKPVYFAGKRMEQSPKADGALKKYLRGAKGFARTVLSWRLGFDRMPQEKRFSAFVNKNLKETPVFRTMDDLKAGCGGLRLLVAGSDQLWNAQITEKRLDPAYFLKFGADDAVRITYAMGANFDACPGYKDILPGLLSGLSAVSLRENKCMEAVSAAAAPGTEIRRDLDPTFLLDAEEYDAFLPEEAPEKERFILTYTMPNDTQGKVNNAARILGERLGLKVIDVTGNPTMGNLKVKDHRTVGPDGFLWYMKHADYVLTNSFHGTAFSVIFRKRFMTIPHSVTGNRMTDLLGELGLSGRTAGTGQDAAARITDEFSFDTAAEQIAALRADSLSYLKRYMERAGQ